MKQIITLLALLAITASAFAQEPVNKRSGAKYSEWNGEYDSLSVEKDILANISYIGDYNFLIEVMAETKLINGTIDTTRLDLKVKGPIKYYNGRNGAMSLRAKEGDIGYLLIKKNVEGEGLIYYLWAQDPTLTRSLRLKIKDPFIIRLIDFLLEPVPPIFRPTGTTKL